MKLVHITDQHCGGGSPEKVEKSFDFLIDQLWGDSASPAFQPKIVYSTGDLTDRPLNVHSEYLKPFLRFVKAAQCPIVLLRGTLSHEPIGTIENLADMSDGKLSIITSPFDEINFGGFDIRGIPGLTRPLIAKWCREAGIPIDGFDDPTEALREILRHIAKSWLGGIKVLGGHLTIRNSMTPSGQTMIGNDIELSIDDLMLAEADLCPLGHIHLHQVLRAAGPHISYGGSPQPCNFGELDQKGFSVFSFPDESAESLSLERVTFPHKPMVKIEMDIVPDVNGHWHLPTSIVDEDQAVMFAQRGFKGMEVKVVYSIPREIAATVDDTYIRVFFAEHGIELAALEKIVKNDKRERIEGIRAITTTEQQYKSWCGAKNQEPRPGAIDKCAALDEVGRVL